MHFRKYTYIYGVPLQDVDTQCGLSPRTALATPLWHCL